MSDALSIGIQGLNGATSQIAKAASSIVNASSTAGNGDVAANLISVQTGKIAFEADAKVIRAADEDNKKLLDILA